VLRWDGGDGSGQEWTALVRGGSDEMHAAVDGLEGAGRIVAERVPSLDEIFVAYVGAAAAPAPDA
jgi:hypothetical protein